MLGLALALLVALLLVGCSSSSKPKEDAGGKGVPTPEQRFGNDPELVADFANLKSCTYEGDRLDHACPQIKTLLLRLKVKSRNVERRDKVVTTLANLLESKQQQTRHAAADSLFFQHRQPKIVAALKQALQREKVPALRATILRQACWTPAPWVLKRARALLQPPAKEPVRAEAASCLGRHPKAAMSARQALRTSLAKDSAARVRGNACAALGSHADAAAVPAMAAALLDQAIAWRCGAALAAVGTKPAFKALLAGVEAAMKRGHVPAQHPAALASFAGRPFFRRPDVSKLLERIAAKRKLSWIARKRAVLELGRLKGSLPYLTRLKASYTPTGATKLSETDTYVLKSVERLLSQ
jgi:uncharacterized protein YjiS (DUF1127 family)